jgi:hypothetical protein
MPPTKPLPDLGGVDLAELQLEILAVLEEQFGPEARDLTRKMQFGDLLSYAGGARVVLGVKAVEARGGRAAAAPPSSVMKWRRFTRSPRRRARARAAER